MIISKEKLMTAKILIIDDDDISIQILKDIFKKAGYRNIISTPDPREADTLYFDLKPDVVVLDIHMPHLSGFDVMERFNKRSPNSFLPIIVISTDENPEVRFLALESGAKDFITKPFDRLEVLIRVKNLIEINMLQNEVREQNVELESKVVSRTQELYQSQLELIQRLARAVEFRDSETGLHIVRMSQYATALARAIGCSNEECEMILIASPLHDIGKIGIPDSILQKPGKLSKEEWEIMKTHTTIGAQLLSGSRSKLLQMAKEIALTHHERWDGTGYPNQLKGLEIPMVGRICCICDVFDALMSSRPYKDPWTVEETIAVINEGSGSYFDPNLVDQFMAIIKEIRQIKEQNEDPL